MGDLRRPRRINNININDRLVYYGELISPIVFEELYLKEIPIYKFISRITTDSERPFATFYSKEREFLNFRKGDILILRVSNRDKQVQFISKLFDWGKFHVPNRFIDLLQIKNHEELVFSVIGKYKKLNLEKKDGTIDMYGLDVNNMRVIRRANNYVTIFLKQRIPVTTPRFVRITQELLELVFLVHGDGHYKTKLFFVNKSPELIRLVMERFEEILKIPKDEWRGRINLSPVNDRNKSREYWKNETNLTDKQFYPISESKLNTGKYGNLRIILDRGPISFIFKFIFEKTKRITSKEDSLYSLNGLLCAEGSADIGKVGLHRITLSFNKKEKSIMEKILDRSDLLNLCKISENKMYVIEGWENLYLFFKTFLFKNIVPFSYHKQRKMNAINGFLEHSCTRTMTKYLSVLKENNSLSTKEFSNLLGIRSDSILDTVRKSKYRRFVNLKKTKRGFIISTTKEGRVFLEIVDKIQHIKEDIMGKLPFEEVERKVIVKREAETDEQYGTRPEKRPVEELIDYGIVNINKPAGPTSHEVSSYVKKILGIKKSGHSGTLEA